MNMTKSEIIKSYMDAKNPKEQIRILTQLNSTDEETIVEILKDAGYLTIMMAGQDMLIEKNKIRKMLKDGNNITCIARQYKTTTTRIRGIIKELKLMDEKENTTKVSTKIAKPEVKAPITNDSRHQALLDEIHSTYIAKNHDYGNSFSRSFEKYGVIAAMVRMEDKWNRLESLTTSKEQLVKDESIKDTLLDLANYCIMTVMEMQKKIND